MKEKSPVFEKNYQYYLERIKAMDFRHIGPKLGGLVNGDEIVIPVFGTPYRIAKGGIAGKNGKRPEYFICIVLFKYILLCPEDEPVETEWQSFKDFKDAAPLISYFQRTVKKPISSHFSGGLDRLLRASQHIGGYPPEIRLSHDLSMTFDALPRIPILLTFNDRDDEFQAQSSVLFQRKTQQYLDMECTAGLGNMLAALLVGADKIFPK